MATAANSAFGVTPSFAIGLARSATAHYGRTNSLQKLLRNYRANSDIVWLLPLIALYDSQGSDFGRALPSTNSSMDKNDILPTFLRLVQQGYSIPSTSASTSGVESADTCFNVCNTSLEEGARSFGAGRG